MSEAKGKYSQLIRETILPSSMFPPSEQERQDWHNGPKDSWHGKIDSKGRFPPEKGRYHMYIGLFCPFDCSIYQAHRANLVRHLKGLTEYIDISVVKPYPKGDDHGWPGWKFPQLGDEYPNATQDKLFGSEYLHEIYFKADKDYKGRYSVPCVWDTQTATIVNNESAELLRTLPISFDSILSPAKQSLQLYPDHLKSAIDEVSVWMQQDLNTGVYKAGFATDQETYDKNVVPVFAALNRAEREVAKNGGPFYFGKDLTEVDIRLYATLIRFDTVYVQHFKCNLGTIRHDYPILNNWMRHLYWNIPGFKETTDFKHIKENYTKSHAGINPLAITPLGPIPDVEQGFEIDFANMQPGGVQLAMFQ